MEAQSSSGQREAQQPPGCSEIAMGQPLMSREKPSLKSMTFSQDIKQNKIVSWDSPVGVLGSQGLFCTQNVSH